MKKLTKAFTMVLVLIFLKGIASGKRVEAQIIVKKYLLPDLVFGNEPTQTVMILLKGSSNAGTGCNPALGMTWLDDTTCSNLKHLFLNQANKMI